MTSTDFSPARHDLILYRGDSVEMPLRFGSATTEGVFDEGYDLTGVDFLAQIRATEDSDDILATFDIELGDQDDPDTIGLVTLSLSEEDTAGLPDKAKWDVQITWTDDQVRTYLAGNVKIKKDVTRAG